MIEEVVIIVIGSILGSVLGVSVGWLMTYIIIKRYTKKFIDTVMKQVKENKEIAEYIEHVKRKIRE